ncbi:uncharacterized protein DUF1189 [Salsuginibacillus halophilus]|uniref:Uncharacterized protein DUF1189 n=1 Tax=Salsuginibacillus halophilus TaxID=517424 RepID=A0A2P8H7X0_9BACI|nr:DUF1189 domain-containing protein [Salsuginibacillus halophilus]PSL42308.1 uncharacterized protein DUF1189 [Salsuginibacillus halophilus]
MNVFQKFFYSLYRPDIIGRLRFQGIGKTIGFVFFLMLLTQIPAAVTFAVSTATTVTQAEEALNEELPSFAISGGTLETEQEEAYIQELDEGRMIIDPERELSEAEWIAEDNSIVLLDTKGFVVTDGERQTITYEQLGDVNLSDEDIAGFADTFSSLLWLFIPIVLVGIYVFTSGMKFVGITVLSLFGLIFRRFVSTRLNYKNIWVMAAYTVTLPTITLAFIDVLAPGVPFTFWLYWVLAITMFALVFRKLPVPKSKQQTHEH